MSRRSVFVGDFAIGYRREYFGDFIVYSRIVQTIIEPHLPEKGLALMLYTMLPTAHDT